MKKIIISFFILLDLAAMGASAFFLMQYVQSQRRKTSKSMVDVRSLPVITKTAPQGVPTTPIPSVTTPASTGSAPIVSSTSAVAPVALKVADSKPVTAAMSAAPKSAPGSNNHNVLFSYFNSKAKEVFIRADFTGWRAEPMKRGDGNKWLYTAVLTPGEYAYCYSVDGRSIKDPANKRTKRVGQTTVSAKTVGSPSPAARSSNP